MTADTRILGAPPRAGTVKDGPSFVAALPQSIAGYTLIKAIGQGGMGCVHEVRHNALGKHFALKLLFHSLRENTEAINRFQCETLALGKLAHPNIVMASDAGVWQGRPYLVTELLTGQDLASRVSEFGKLDVESVIAIATQLSDALRFAHDRGYFHRDIKPSNVFYQTDGIAKLLDFGLVRCESNHLLTQAGSLMGTVDFVAPEQARNAAQADAASDIYSLGCTLIYLLSGDVPFPDCHYPSLTAKLHAHLHDNPSWFVQAKSQHPDWLVNLIQAMVAKDPSDRPNNCQLIHTSLKNHSFADNIRASASKRTSRIRGSAPGLKLSMGVGLTLAVSAGLWVVGAGKLKKEPSSVPASLSHMRAIGTRDSSEFTLPNPPSGLSSTTQAEEKTLPVTLTQNARATSLPSLKSSKRSIAPGVFLSKDKTHE